MGRGGGTNNHAGNLNYRKIIEQFKPVYSKSPKNGKLQYSCKVVDIVRSLNPPGRFLKKVRGSFWRSEATTTVDDDSIRTTNHIL